MASAPSRLMHSAHAGGGGSAALPLQVGFRKPSLHLPSLLPPRRAARSVVFLARASSKASRQARDSIQPGKTAPPPADEEAVEGDAAEEELPWIQDKAMDLVEFTGTITQAIPGPRIGGSAVPVAAAVPIAFVGFTFVWSFVKAVRKFTSPQAQRKRMVNKNASLLWTMEQLFQDSEGVTHSALKELMKETGFSMEGILRKYVRYALNEKPFDLKLVARLIHLRKATMLEAPQVAGVLNEISKRVVKDKGPIIINPSGFTERGFKRKLALNALFGKILYLSELPEFCWSEGSLAVKDIFGVTDDDADELRIHTLSEAGDFETLAKMVGLKDAEEHHSDDSNVSEDVDPEPVDDD